MHFACPPSVPLRTLRRAKRTAHNEKRSDRTGDEEAASGHCFRPVHCRECFRARSGSQFTGSPPAGATAEVERVVVTGSNIPTAEEVGPNPVDTYRSEDIQKLGAYNATDLLTKLPQEMGSTVNQNIANGGDGSVIPNLRGLLPKETLVLIDGKRPA